MAGDKDGTAKESSGSSNGVGSNSSSMNEGSNMDGATNQAYPDNSATRTLTSSALTKEGGASVQTMTPAQVEEEKKKQAEREAQARAEAYAKDRAETFVRGAIQTGESTQAANQQFGAAGFIPPSSTPSPVATATGATHSTSNTLNTGIAGAGSTGGDYAWMANNNADLVGQNAISGAASYDPTTAGREFLANYNPTAATGNFDVNGVQGQGLSAEAQAAMNANIAGAKGNELASFLVEQAQGKAGPSAAQAQLQAATDANIKAQQAAAAANRGQFNPALLRAISAKAAETQQQSANQSAQLKAQEAQAAAQTAAGLTAQLSGQNIQGSQATQELATKVATDNADRRWDVVKTNKAADDQANMAKLGIEGQLSALDATAQNEAKKFLAGEMSDVLKLDSASKNKIIGMKLDLEAAGRESAKERLWDANKSQAENDMVIAQFNQAEDNKIALANASMINDLTSADATRKANAETAFNELRANFITNQLSMGFSREQAEQDYKLELAKMANNIAAAKAGKAPEPTKLERAAGFIGTLVGAGSALAKMA